MISNNKNKFINIPWNISDILMVYAYLFSISFVVVGGLLLIGLNQASAFFSPLINLILNLSTVTAVLVIIKMYGSSFVEVMGIKKHGLLKHLNIGLYVSVVLIVSTSIVALLYSKLTGVQSQNPYADLPDENIKVISFLAIMIAPFVEEVFYRGFLQPVFVKSLGVAAGIIVTSIVFAISHSQYLDYEIALVGVTTIGLILSIVRYKTDSIMPGVFAHLINNILAAISLL